MKFEINNTAALKWTEEKVLDILGSMRQQAKQEEVISLTKALNDRDISRKAWCYWREKFKYIDEIQELMDLIEDSIAARLEEGGIRKEYNASTVQFILRHSYGWVPVKEEKEKAPEPVKREAVPDDNYLLGLAGDRVLGVNDNHPRPYLPGEKPL